MVNGHTSDISIVLILAAFPNKIRYKTFLAENFVTNREYIIQFAIVNTDKYNTIIIILKRLYFINIINSNV